MSEDDKKNPLLKRVANIIEAQGSIDDAKDIREFTGLEDYPYCLKDKIIRIGERIGRVEGVNSSNEYEFIILRDLQSGKETKFRADIVKKNFS